MKQRKKLTIIIAVMLLASLLSGCASQRNAKLIGRGDSQMVTGNYRSAARYYKRAGSGKTDDKTHLRLALALVKYGKYSQAQVELQKVTTPCAKTTYLVALCHLGLNDVASAQRSLEKSLQAKPNDSYSLALLGRIRFLQKQYTQSVESYQDALSVTSKKDIRTMLYYNLAMVQLETGQFKLADSNYKQYLIAQNYLSKADNRVAGAIAYAVGDHDRALRHWQKLSGKEKQTILNAIVDESQVYGELALAR